MALAGTLCVCVVIPFILDVRHVDAPTGATQEEDYTGFLHLPCAVLTLILIAIRIQPPLSLVDCEVKFYETANSSFPTTCWALFFVYLLVRKYPSSYDCTEVRQRQKVSRLPTEAPERPAVTIFPYFSSRVSKANFQIFISPAGAFYHGS